MRKLLLDAGFQQAKIVPTGGVPGVFATLDAGAPTRSASTSCTTSSSTIPPNGRRRRSKGGSSTGPRARRSWAAARSTRRDRRTAFLSALHAFKATGRKLPVNIVLVAEGEEEIASPNFHQIVAEPEVRAAMEKAVGVFIPVAGAGVDGGDRRSTSAPRARSRSSSFRAVRIGDAGQRRTFTRACSAIVDSPAWRLVKALDTLGEGRRPHAGGRGLVRECEAADARVRRS